MRMKKKWIIVIAPVLAAAFIYAIGELVMHLWNWLATGLFGLPALTFWQAWGLLLLCRLLFGGFGGGGRERRRRPSGPISPEERERLREKLRERWGCETPPAEAGPAA